MPKARKLIVGIDPGTSSSFAAFDLEGNFIAVSTFRNPGRERIIEEILKYGIPVVVATDMHSPPEFVVQIASNFNAKLFVPSDDLLQREKEELTKEMELANAHERDSAASALNFIRHYKNKMAWIDRNIKEKDLSEFNDEIKTYVLQGVPLGKVVDYLRAKEETEEKKIPKTGKSDETIGRRKKECSEIKELIESNAKLRSLLSVISAENRLLGEKLKESEERSRTGMETNRMLKSKELQISRLKTVMRRQAHEISRLEQSLKNVKGNPETKGKERPQKKELKGEDIEDIVDDYRESQ